MQSLYGSVPVLPADLKQRPTSAPGALHRCPAGPPLRSSPNPVPRHVLVGEKCTDTGRPGAGFPCGEESHPSPPEVTVQVVKALDVLIIDDDPLLGSGLRSLLEWEGFRCAEAGDGRKALDIARRWPPQCVFVDLDLPGVDGFAVVRQLRADPRMRRAHVHCLTGRGDAAARRRARRAGCEAFLLKPVEPGALLGILRQQVTGPNSQWVSGLTRAGVQELVDWLRNNGCRPVEVSFQGEAGFAVRCVCPPGLVLGLEAGRLRLVPA